MVEGVAGCAHLEFARHPERRGSGPIEQRRDAGKKAKLTNEKSLPIATWATTHRLKSANMPQGPGTD